MDFKKKQLYKITPFDSLPFINNFFEYVKEENSRFHFKNLLGNLIIHQSIIHHYKIEEK